MITKDSSNGDVLVSLMLLQPSETH
jgi:hypothetical protein